MDLRKLYEDALNDTPWTDAHLDDTAEDLELIAKQLRDGAKLMREKDLPSIHIKAKTAFGQGLRSLKSVGESISGQVLDQYKAKKNHTQPSWLLFRLMDIAAKNGTTVNQILEAAGVITSVAAAAEEEKRARQKGWIKKK